MDVLDAMEKETREQEVVSTLSRMNVLDAVEEEVGEHDILKNIVKDECP